MALCETCAIWDDKYDEFIANYEDSTPDKDDQRVRHHCRMYDDFIPQKITYENGDCKFYEEDKHERR